MSDEKSRIFGLDFLRAAAVLAVVFHHSFPVIWYPEWVHVFGALGSMGPDLLLVLSGYLIGRSLLPKEKFRRFLTPADVWRFYVKRWLRTLPPYYFFVLIAAALSPPFFQQLIDHKEYFLFLQSFAWTEANFCTQFWTLPILEFFYLFFPLMLFIAARLTTHRLPCLVLTIAPFLIGPFIARMYQAPVGSYEEFCSTYRQWVILRLDTPIAGVAIALLQVEAPHLWAWLRKHAWVGYSAFGVCVVYYLSGYPGLFTHHWMQVIFYPVVAVAVALLFPVICSWTAQPSLWKRSVENVSQVSYSIYVSQNLGFTVGLTLLVMAGIERTQWYIVYPFYIVVMGTATLLAYHFVEEPFMRLREAKTPPRSYTAALLQRLRRVPAEQPVRNA